MNNLWENSKCNNLEVGAHLLCSQKSKVGRSVWLSEGKSNGVNISKRDMNQRRHVGHLKDIDFYSV